mgnify:CR=1 FL=1
MDSPVIVALLIRRVISLGLLFGAILALWYGFRLYKNGAGLGSNHIVAEYGELRVCANSIGAALMITACGWASLVVLSAPKYSNGPDGEVVEIASTGEIVIDADSIDGYVGATQLFRDAVSSSKNNLVLYGKPATVDLENISQHVRLSENGNYLIGAKVQNSNGNSVYTVFEAASEDGAKVRFRPVTVSESTDGINVADSYMADSALEGENDES